jgi:hypothetical protein
MGTPASCADSTLSNSQRHSLGQREAAFMSGGLQIMKFAQQRELC